MRNYLYIQCKDFESGWRQCQILRVPWTREKFQRLRTIVVEGMRADDRASIGGVWSEQARFYLERSGLTRADTQKLQSEIETQHGDIVGFYSFLGYLMCLTVRVRLNDPKEPERIGDPIEKPRWSRPFPGVFEHQTSEGRQ